MAPHPSLVLVGLAYKRKKKQTGAGDWLFNHPAHNCLQHASLYYCYYVLDGIRAERSNLLVTRKKRQKKRNRKHFSKRGLWNMIFYFWWKAVSLFDLWIILLSVCNHAMLYAEERGALLKSNKNQEEIKKLNRRWKGRRENKMNWK